MDALQLMPCHHACQVKSDRLSILVFLFWELNNPYSSTVTGRFQKKLSASCSWIYLACVPKRQCGASRALRLPDLASVKISTVALLALGNFLQLSLWSDPMSTSDFRAIR